MVTPPLFNTSHRKYPAENVSRFCDQLAQTFSLEVPVTGSPIFLLFDGFSYSDRRIK